MSEHISNVAEAHEALASAFQEGQPDAEHQKPMMGEMVPLKRSVVKQNLKNIDKAKVQAIMTAAAKASKASKVPEGEAKNFI